jgi:hypothetical protein
VVSPVANSLQPGDSNFTFSPSTSRWNFTALSLSATNLIAYLSVFLAFVSPLCSRAPTILTRRGDAERWQRVQPLSDRIHAAAKQLVPMATPIAGVRNQ